MCALPLLVVPILASAGDQLPEFQRCVKFCEVLRCPNGAKNHPDLSSEKIHELKRDQTLQQYFSEGLNLWEMALGWDCEGNCDYECQRIVTEERVIHGLEIHQFHGKWPFLRVWGVQELMSTVFSIGNFIPNYYGFKLIKSHLNRERDADYKRLYFAYLMVSIISMCAWTFSSIFHLKDTWNRERLDYFFAGMTVLTGFYAIILRFFRLYKSKTRTSALSALCVFLYGCHVVKLLNDWSYSYNMLANVVLGVVQNILWVTLSVNQFNQVADRRKSLMQNILDTSINWTLVPCLLVSCVVFGMSFELYDFAPLGELLDAHALWHFVTIWPQIFWYPYMVKDVEFLKVSKVE